jgi:hypothetical protein
VARIGATSDTQPLLGNLGGERAYKQAPSISDGGAVMGWQTSLRAEMGRGRRRAGPAAEKTAHDDFFHFKSIFQLNKSAGENKNRRNKWGAQENVKFLHGDRIEYLPQLSCWAL